MLDRGVEHLSGYDHGFMLAYAFVDEHCLYAGDALCRHLYSEVAACHHNAIGGCEDGVEVVDTLLVLYLGYYLCLGAVGVEYCLHLHDAGGRPHE